MVGALRKNWVRIRREKHSRLGRQWGLGAAEALVWVEEAARAWPAGGQDVLCRSGPEENSRGWGLSCLPLTTLTLKTGPRRVRRHWKNRA